MLNNTTKQSKAISVDSVEYAKTFDDMQIGNFHPFFNGNENKFQISNYHAKNPAYLDLVHHVFETSVPIIKKGIKNKKGNYVVYDGGAGTSNFTLTLAAEFPEVTFIAGDIQNEMLKKGREKAKQKGIKNIYFIKHDIENIEDIVKKYGKIDYAYSVQCLFATRSKKDTEKPQRILNNIYNSLADNSSFLLIDFNKKHNPLSWLNYVIKEGIIHHVK